MAIKSSKFFKIIALALCFSLVFKQSGFAQMAGELDLSSRFARLTSSFTQVNFRPVHLRYLYYDNLNNNFKLLLDKGNAVIANPAGAKQSLDQDKLKSETKTLLNYFFIGISLPNESFWVNLRPDAADNIIGPEVEKTDLGKILLEADLQLKKDTANFTSPQTPEGKEYWDKLYKKAGELFGSENITIPTLTRPWIVPGEIIIRETPDNAYIYKATLKVMLEQDYLKGSAVYNFQDERSRVLNEYSSQLIRELIIPKLTKDVNTAKRYAPLRQVYYSLILAQWFKQKFYGKGGLYSYLIDKQNLTGLTSAEPWSKASYFHAYQKSFQEGEYNIKEQVYSLGAQTIRNYMSGGIAIGPEITNVLQKGIIPGSAAKAIPAINNNTGLINVAGSPTVSEPFQVNLEAAKKIVFSQKEPSSLLKPAGHSSLGEKKTASSAIAKAKEKIALVFNGKAIKAQDKDYILEVDTSFQDFIFIKIKSRDPGDSLNIDALSFEVKEDGIYKFNIKLTDGLKDGLSGRGVGSVLCGILGNALQKAFPYGAKLKARIINVETLEYIKNSSANKKLSEVFPETLMGSLLGKAGFVGFGFLNNEAPVQYIDDITQAKEAIKETGGFWVVAKTAGSPAGEKIFSSQATGTKEDIIEFYYDKEYFIKQVGGAVVNMVKYLKAENFTAIIISGDSARLTLPFLKKAWERLFPQVLFPPVFSFQGKRLYTNFNITNGEMDSMASLPQDDGTSVLLRDVKDKRICFVDDFSQGGTKYQDASRKLATFGVKNASFAFIVSSKKAKNQEYFSGAVDSWLPIDMNMLTWQQRTSKVLPGLEAQNRWDGILNFIQKSTYEETNSDAVSSPVIGSSPVDEDAKGGIDLRALPIISQPVIPAQAASAILKGNPLRGQSLIQLQKEWKQIENMISAGIVPSTDRIRDYLAVCCASSAMNQETDKVLSCLADIMRMEEERVENTEPGLKEMLSLLESDKSANEMQLALAKITVLAKEPKAIPE